MPLAMDNALMTLSLDEEDMLFVMSDLLEFSLAEENKISLMGDILFGVLEESQVRIDPPTGRWNIAKEVLEEMRRYLAVDTGESKTVKVDKIQKSIKLEICTEIGTTPAGYF
ncbi:hypothetical protein YC2023_094103 [Brassica napus]